MNRLTTFPKSDAACRALPVHFFALCEYMARANRWELVMTGNRETMLEERSDRLDSGIPAQCLAILPYNGEAIIRAALAAKQQPAAHAIARAMIWQR